MSEKGYGFDLLYVGHRKDALMDWWENLRAKNPEAKAMILEVWGKNVEECRPLLPEGITINQGDVRVIGWLFFPNYFKNVYWRNGVEHIGREEIPDTIEQLKRVASEKIVLEYPVVEYIQGAAFGNPYEIHRWYPVPEVFEELGFETFRIGANGEAYQSIWKK